MRKQLLIYGSCVARDIVRIIPGRFGLVHYAARQSWISAASRPLKRPTNIDLGSFSTRSIVGDFLSNIPGTIRKFGGEADVILIDIASDRHGVYPVGDSFISNTGELRRANLLQTVKHGPLVEFGTREHQRLFKLAVAKMKRTMVAAGVFDKALVIKIQFAGKSNDGTPMPLARGMTSDEVNSKYEYYYQVFEDLGFHVTPTPPKDLQVANTEHKWGLQQDHFIDSLYYWWADEIDQFIAERQS